jgi:hypothetical protein
MKFNLNVSVEVSKTGFVLDIMRDNKEALGNMRIAGATRDVFVRERRDAIAGVFLAAIDAAAESVRREDREKPIPE